MSVASLRWHHRPIHLFIPNTMYMVTACTLYKAHIFQEAERCRLLQEALFEITDIFDWNLQAWAVFSNHYHFIARSPDDATTLRSMIQRFHAQTARLVNRMDRTEGRQVWFQYWDTVLTFEKSYYARLNYVHNNPVKHGLVLVAERYPFCSAGWFKWHAQSSFRRKVESFKYDRVHVIDDF